MPSHNICSKVTFPKLKSTIRVTRPLVRLKQRKLNLHFGNSPGAAFPLLASRRLKVPLYLLPFQVSALATAAGTLHPRSFLLVAVVKSRVLQCQQILRFLSKLPYLTYQTRPNQLYVLQMRLVCSATLLLIF